MYRELRRGKWTPEEEQYALYLIQVTSRLLLRVFFKHSLGGWLLYNDVISTVIQEWHATSDGWNISTNIPEYDAELVTLLALVKQYLVKR